MSVHRWQAERLLACAQGHTPLRSLLEIEARELRGLRALARRLRRAGRRAQARAIVEGCLALDGLDAPSWTLLAELALADARFEEALGAAEAALQIAAAVARLDPWADLLAARALLGLGAGERARPHLERLLASDAADPLRAQAASLLGSDGARFGLGAASPRPEGSACALSIGAQNDALEERALP